MIRIHNSVCSHCGWTKSFHTGSIHLARAREDPTEVVPGYTTSHWRCPGFVYDMDERRIATRTDVRDHRYQSLH